MALQRNCFVEGEIRLGSVFGIFWEAIFLFLETNLVVIIIQLLDQLFVNIVSVSRFFVCFVRTIMLKPHEFQNFRNEIKIYIRNPLFCLYNFYTRELYNGQARKALAQKH